MAPSEELARGRHAFATQAWAQAYTGLAAAQARRPLGADDLGRLATAAYLSGHDRPSAEAWARAYALLLQADRPEPAVRCAFWLALGLVLRGDLAQGGGWLARANRLVAERELDCVENGYLHVLAALGSLNGGSHQVAHDEFERVGAVADRFGDSDLAALSLLGRGQALCGLGRPREGVGLLDEAMVAVIAGEVSPVVAGLVYCAVIDACQRGFDVRRAREWTTALSHWCAGQPGLVPYRGQCLVHRSQVLLLHGAWTEAISEARSARDQLSEPPQPAVALAHYQIGELDRLRGRLTAAEESYRRVQESGGVPQPGLALVRLAQGRTEAAVAAIDAAVAAAVDVVSRVRQLPAFIEIMLAADRREPARAAAQDLAGVAETAGMPYLLAAADQSLAAVLLAEGEPRAAFPLLRTCARRWQELEAPYEGARAHLLLALTCRDLGDHESAGAERDLARRTFAHLGAEPDLQRIRELFGPGLVGAADRSLSPRERQVLRRVSRGRTNREIAEELFISVKTVERHLGNIFGKLGAANRAAATAIAMDRRLL